MKSIALPSRPTKAVGAPSGPRAQTAASHGTWSDDEHTLRQTLGMLAERDDCARACLSLPGAERGDPPNAGLKPLMLECVDAARAIQKGRLTAVKPGTRAPAGIESSGSLVFPVGDGRKRRGELTLEPVQGADAAALICAGASAAQELNRALRRQELARRSAAAFGHPLTFVGWSDASRRLEARIHEAAEQDLPTLIVGEFGCELALAAFALHIASARADGPFVEFIDDGDSVQRYGERLVAALREAEGGTLVVHEVGALSPAHARALGTHLPALPTPWLRRPFSADRRADVRVIGLCTTGPEGDSGMDLSLRPLIAAFDFVRVEVPPLRDRREDIPWLVRRICAGSGAGGRAVGPEQIDRLMSHDWPGNMLELERVVAMLMLSPETCAAALRRIGPPSADGDVEAPRAPAHGAESATLGRRILEGHLDPNLHPGLLRALLWLRDHYQEEIGSTELARAACVSASHLAHLFKGALGVSFRPLLAEVRIERAKDLLVSQRQRRITEISMDVGFGDLSHFIKSFKRTVGMSPREFRQRQFLAGTDPAGATGADGG